MFYNENIKQKIENGDNMLHVFLINSFSGNEKKTVGIREQLERIINIEYLVFNSEYAGHEEVLAKQICELFPEEKIRFYSCGGSGTFRNILKGIPKDREIEIAELAYGLTNDFLSLYGEEREKFEHLGNLISGQAEKMDYLETTVGAAHNTVSVGLDGIILKGALMLKRLPFFRGSVPYFLSSIAALLNTNVPKLKIIADGEVFEGKFYEIAIGNGNLLGGMFHFGKKAHPKNGKMRLILVPAKNIFYKLRMTNAAVWDKQEVLEQNSICRMVKRIELSSLEEKELAVNIDGELELAKTICVEVRENEMLFVEPKDINRGELSWKKETH